MSKEELKDLEKAVVLAEEEYRNLGLINTFGLLPDERRVLDQRYVRAESEMIKAQNELRLAQQNQAINLICR